jgi:RNA polymerase sigma-70 factor, ECF subfamily
LESREYTRVLEPLLEQAAAYARALLHNTHDAEDAVQDAALRGWQRIDTFDARRPFKGWWFAILRNCCVDILRRAKTRAAESLEGRDLPEPALEEPDWTQLVSAIESISEIHREVLRLRYFAELSYAEIAEALAIPKGTVMSRLHLARKALATAMGKDEK